jgi:UDP-2,3-diacylglucosamine pyrophosphatase LpxH
MLTTLVLSDLHLGARNCRTDLLDRLLWTDFDRLILNGDTVNSLNFERFRANHWHIIHRLQTIAADRDRELVLIRGNHDGKYTSDDGFGELDALASLLGTELHEDYELAVGDENYLILHGDQFDRSLNMTWMGHAADWCYGHIQSMSRPTAQWLKMRVKHWGGVVKAVRAGAIRRARGRGCAGVITGHTHFCEDDLVDGIHVMNTGCWVDSPCTYIKVENGQARLHYWGDIAEEIAGRRELVAVG